MLNKQFSCGSKTLGENHPCFVIAEAGVNHNGDIAQALKLVDIAADAGADAVKFQTFSADKLASSQAPKARYQKTQTDPEESQLAMLKKLELSREDHEQIIAYCQTRKIAFLSTPFDESSADLLDDLGIPLFKVSSGDLTNIPFLTYLARKQKPLIISTGMATLAEVEIAVRALEDAGQSNIAILHCVSNYPADPANVNLKAMQTLRHAFGTPTGYSDHTLGIDVSLGAVALGAQVIEKHFTIDCSLPGPDHQASLEPEALKTLIQGIRTIESALGDGIKKPFPSEYDTAIVARKSLTASRDIPPGTRIEASMLAIKRPGTGIPPAQRETVIGLTTHKEIPSDTPITWDMLK